MYPIKRNSCLKHADNMSDQIGFIAKIMLAIEANFSDKNATLSLELLHISV